MEEKERERSDLSRMRNSMQLFLKRESPGSSSQTTATIEDTGDASADERDSDRDAELDE